jgi:SAM-dependent methyltransferase
MSFKDHFSKQSSAYAAARPGYPDELFRFLTSIVKQKELAWDCGCGNGQAAVSLASYFRKVIATDASQAQLEKAFTHERVEYRLAPSEKSGLPYESIDLVTAAAAVHWFDHDVFYAEVKRVLRPGGIIAVWTYCENDVDELVDPHLHELERGILGSYWPKESALVHGKYKDLPFPFELIDAPVFKCEIDWDLPQLLAYLFTWSATQNYIKKHNSNPIDIVLPDLQKAWRDPTLKKKMTMELTMKVGRV